MMTLISFVLGTFLLVVVLFSCASAYMIWQNRLPLSDPPGRLARLHIYLSTHVAATSDQSPYPELAHLKLNAATDEVSEVIKKLIPQLGWELSAEGRDGLELHAVITTKKMKFKDDMLIRISALEAGHSQVSMHSESRTGTADFGTNARHILDLKQSLTAHFQ